MSSYYSSSLDISPSKTSSYVKGSTLNFDVKLFLFFLLLSNEFPDLYGESGL